MTRKGQAALEFLSTYGFAFLIILVMIGALWYFGIFDAGELLPEQCNFPPEFGCDDAQISYDVAAGTASVNIFLIRAGSTISIDAADAGVATDNFDSDGTGTCVVNTCPNPIDPVSGLCLVQGGQAFELQCAMAGVYPAAGDKVRSEIQFDYQEVGGRFAETVSGSISENLVRV